MREPIAINPAAQRIPGRGFWALRDLPTALWLIFAVVVSLIHRELPAPRWLLIHLMMLGALSHAILVWSQYFATALLKLVNTAQARRQQSYRLALMNCGALLVLIGVLGQFTVPYFMGPNAPQQLGVAISNQFQSFNQPQQAAAIAVVVFVLASGIAAVYVWVNFRSAKKEGRV